MKPANALVVQGLPDHHVVGRSDADCGGSLH